MHYKREIKAMRIHAEEVERAGATFYNCGWGIEVDGNWISICSKTSEGLLTTNVDFDGVGTVDHYWTPKGE